MPEEQYPDAPECNKLVANGDEIHRLGSFLEWLIDDKDFAICEECHDPEAFPEYQFFPIRGSFEALLGEYYGIDMQKVEEERRAILAYCQRYADTHPAPSVSMKVDGEEFMDEE